MNQKTLTVVASISGVLTIMAGVASAANVSFGGVPAGTLIDDQTTGGTGSRIFDIDANANHGRGNVFVAADDGTAATQWSLQTIGFLSADTLDYSGGSVIVDIFSGTSEQWATGTGSTTESGSIYAGTTVTPLYQETFDLVGSPSSGDYFTVSLTTPVVVDEGGDYGFLIRYIAETSPAGPTSIFYLENTNGSRIALTTTGAAGVGSRGMNAFVAGVAVPEPSTTLLLGLGGLALLRRRRK